jgi:cytochrome c-type biogenesis protein CcmH
MTRRSLLPALFTALLLGMMLLGTGAAIAVDPGEMLADPALEARARAIGQELRCLVCQNESIDESNADLAHDLRVLVRQRLKAGDSDQQAIGYIVARYGQFVLLRPPVEPATYALWFGPIAFLLLGAIGIGLYLRRRGAGASGEPAPLNREEAARLARLVEEGRER